MEKWMAFKVRERWAVKIAGSQFHITGWGNVTQTKEQAELIASAPEMLESIEEFLKGYEEVRRQEHHLGSAIEGALWDVIEPLYTAYRKAKYGEDS